jgi:formylglycine-generating enzyme required for sulfatase activity
MKAKSRLGLSVIIALAIMFIAAKKDNSISIKNELFNHGFIEIEKDKIYVEAHETTNKDYRAFLNYLKKNGKESLYTKCKYDSVNWTTRFAFNYNEPMAQNYHWHPAYDHYPIVNISYEAANEYCKWLSEEYHKMNKREFKRVVFRLPTEKEWINACRPFVNNNLPWYGNQAYNQDYEFLANVKFNDFRASKGSNYVEDGGFHSLIVGHYKPNRVGLYDMIGNVSEMTSVIGVQKGGSWDNFIEECGVDKSQTYIDADPRVGFRVFMEVIEI